LLIISLSLSLSALIIDDDAMMHALGVFTGFSFFLIFPFAIFFSLADVSQLNLLVFRKVFLLG